MEKTETPPDPQASKDAHPEAPATAATPKPASEDVVEEIGGPKGPDPTRFGDWSVNGRCVDF